MFGPPGHLYVYFTYGMHLCCNVVVRPRGHAERGPAAGGGGRRRARRWPASGARAPPTATSPAGPARLCQALGIDLDHDGADLARRPAHARARRRPPADVSTGPRVGLRGAPDRPWRFWLAGEPTVSRTARRSRRAGARADPDLSARRGRC